MTASKTQRGHTDPETALESTPTPTTLRLEEAIDKAFTDKHANFMPASIAVEEAINLWWWDFQRLYWQRWDCESDRCPGQPAWDEAISDQGQLVLDAAVAEVLSLIRQRMTEFAVTFQRGHPEAVLRRGDET